MYIFHTFSIGYADLDKLLDLDQAMIQIRSVKNRWRELAEEMRLPETLIEQVSLIKAHNLLCFSDFECELKSIENTLFQMVCNRLETIIVEMKLGV